MTLLWQRGEGSVNDVIENLPKGRELAYTSVSTMLRILEQKGWVKTRKEGRGHVYIPAVAKTEYEKKAIRHVVDHVFAGEPSALVRQLLETGDLDQAEINRLRALLDQTEERRRGQK